MVVTTLKTDLFTWDIYTRILMQGVFFLGVTPATTWLAESPVDKPSTVTVATFWNGYGVYWLWVLENNIFV